MWKRTAGREPLRSPRSIPFASQPWVPGEYWAEASGSPARKPRKAGNSASCLRLLVALAEQVSVDLGPSSYIATDRTRPLHASSSHDADVAVFVSKRSSRVCVGGALRRRRRARPSRALNWRSHSLTAASRRPALSLSSVRGSGRFLFGFRLARLLHARVASARRRRAGDGGRRGRDRRREADLGTGALLAAGQRNLAGNRPRRQSVPGLRSPGLDSGFTGRDERVTLS
jgi:hypothetical protein